MNRCLPALLFAVACAPDIGPDGDGSTDGGPATSSFTVDGVIFATIDATSEDDWVPYSFAEQGVVEPADADLSFQRYRVALGDGVEVARLPGEDLQTVVAPDDGWLVDADDPVDDEHYALFEWYDYNPADHTLSPKDEVIVVRLPSGTDVAMAFDGYYDDAGTPGYVAFRWTTIGSAR
jgi:hypothetical protein